MDKGLLYCQRCCIPASQEGTAFDEWGICNACRSAEDKMRIDWSSRRQELERILEDARAAGEGRAYDCLVPISGGKDSLFQLHVLVKEFGMRPLAATFSHNWFSTTGLFNLLNAIEALDVDHVMFTPRRSQVNELARLSLGAIGDSCWHCHAGVGAYPLKVALDYKISLVIWGESVVESSGRGTYRNPVTTFDREYFLRVSAKKSAGEMIELGATTNLDAYEPPALKELDQLAIRGIHLGDFIFWDDERQTEFVMREYGWRQTDIEGTYKRYKSAECIMPGVHDFTCYLKRGFGRATTQASADIRAGLVTRTEAFTSLVPYERVEPAALDIYLDATSQTKEEFYRTMETHRVKTLGAAAEMPLIDSHAAPRPAPEQALQGLRRALDCEHCNRTSIGEA